MSGQGGFLHRCQQCLTPPTRSCTLHRGSITVRTAGPKLVAKRRRQIRKDSAKCCVVCSMELAGHVLSTRPKVLSPLLVCWRYIRYQSDLPLVSRGFSVASGIRTKCPPELASGSGRLLDKHRPARDTFILMWGGRMPSQGQTPHPSERRSTPPTRSYALYRGCVTVRRAGPKRVAKNRPQLRKDSAKCRVLCSMELTAHVR